MTWEYASGELRWRPVRMTMTGVTARVLLVLALSACWRAPDCEVNYVWARPTRPVQTCVGVMDVVNRAVERYWRTPPGSCRWHDGADDAYWFCRLNEVQEQAIEYYDLLVEVGELCAGKL